MRPVEALKVTATVAGVALDDLCEFTALYCNVKGAPVAPVVRAEVKGPSAFKLTHMPLTSTPFAPLTAGQLALGVPTICAVNGSLKGSVSFTSTPGGLICSRDAMGLV